MAGYKALYRETRPEVFSELLGQDHIVRILQHQIATNTVSHAYLFCGTRGTGKTTTARILAKALNCTAEDGPVPCGVCPNCRAIAEGSFMDVIEIDAASNNKVDNIRELRESVKYPPSVGRKKVYIIDEVHMLTTGAFNALLKTLEEPPEDVVFILATTNPEKVPQTVLSRCMRLDFRRVSTEVLAAHMGEICEKRGVEITPDALRLLATNAEGSVRDSLSILEQCLASGEAHLNREIILDYLGTAGDEFFGELTEDVMRGDISAAFLLLDRALRDGGDVKQLMKDWMGYFRSLMIAKYVGNPEEMLNMAEDSIQRLKEQSRNLSAETLNRGIVTLAKANNDARYSTQARTLMEVAIVTIASGMAYGAEPAPVPPAGVGAAAPAAARNPAAGTSASVQKSAVGTSASVQKSAARTSASARKSAAGERMNRVSQFGDEEGAATGQAEESAGAPESSAREGGYSMQDLEDIWNNVADRISGDRPALSAATNGVVLTGISDDQFRLQVTNGMAGHLLKQNREYIMDLMEKETGRRRSMVLRDPADSAEPEGGNRDEKLRDLAKGASEILGVDVDVR
ncbi:DNA polymerase III subunit gamma/tau [Eubacterium pyruvativorans]|uniref:DNA polymerase III subunit gamma/tau n=1 Tax=Eubacterium pyruvativorans TaxID=155865 RepID=UPI0023F1DCB9|nr:DNA polymerase III subunit gamma/tau [Eubacterium pyruvativorans]MCI5746804.1 DNA polymerase III subunit gamma/tau [Eubacterium pyruvativorans]